MKKIDPIVYAIVGIALVVIAGVAFVFFRSHREGPMSGTGTTTPISGDGVDIQTTGGNATVTEVPVGPAQSAPAIPSLDRPVTFSGSSLPPEAQTAVKAQIAEVVATLKKDPTKLDYWLQLGIDRKMAGDYEGAAEAWAYVHAVAPNDEISVADLADLYANFVKDYPKAETYYKKAIANDPRNIDNYRNLYTLYTYSYKTGTTAAHDILEQGLKANPGNQDLTNLLSGKAQ